MKRSTFVSSYHNRSSICRFIHRKSCTCKGRYIFHWSKGAFKVNINLTARWKAFQRSKNKTPILFEENKSWTEARVYLRKLGKWWRTHPPGLMWTDGHMSIHGWYKMLVLQLNKERKDHTKERKEAIVLSIFMSWSIRVIRALQGSQGRVWQIDTKQDENKSYKIRSKPGKGQRLLFLWVTLM